MKVSRPESERLREELSVCLERITRLGQRIQEQQQQLKEKDEMIEKVLELSREKDGQYDLIIARLNHEYKLLSLEKEKTELSY